MGMSQDEYYNMMPRDFAAKIEGYGKRLHREQDMQRKAAFFSLIPHVQKGLSYPKFCKDFWQLPGDIIEKEKLKDTGMKEVAPDIWKLIKQKQSAFQFKGILQEHGKKLSQSRRKNKK